jgi:myo-inositol 2-dehydrogenase / D-chiro-inositol 1-dehydrogenase
MKPATPPAMNPSTRRQFLKTSALGAAGLAAFPSLFPRSLFAATTPARRIQVAQIGCGRMGLGDMRGVMNHPLARVVAVCDLDRKRLAAAQARAVEFYRKQGETSVTVLAFADYRELLGRPDIDAVVVSTPDHWHALVAVEAALAGKHLYVQKPVTYDIAEAIALRTAVRARKVILQTGSQQRSETPWTSFRSASEAVRNGRIGRLQTIKIGVGLDQPKGVGPAPMPVPENLDYDRWLGPAPEQPYMEGRVHPQNSLGRPGWITTEDFGLGMITNWGAHHLDIAQWAMGMELSGPTRIEAKADFMTGDIWTVHHHYHVELGYPNGVQVILDDRVENGLRFEGSEGWVFCARDAEKVTSSDPNSTAGDTFQPLRASDPKILSPLGGDARRWPASRDHYGNWLESIAARRDPVAPIDQSARSLEACAAAWIGMKLKRKLAWDPARERFVDDDAANALCSRRPRQPEYDVQALLKKAGLTPGRAPGQPPNAVGSVTSPLLNSTYAAVRSAA